MELEDSRRNGHFQSEKHGKRWEDDEDQSGLRVYHGIPNFQTNSDVQESFGRMSFVLFCFDLRCSNKTKRRRAQNDVFFFQQVKLKTKKYSCSHCPELFSPKWHRLCCNNSSACAFPYHEAVASHVKVFVPQEDADDCPTEAGLKLG